jgi:hypothetical protein
MAAAGGLALLREDSGSTVRLASGPSPSDAGLQPVVPEVCLPTASTRADLPVQTEVELVRGSDAVPPPAVVAHVRVLDAHWARRAGPDGDAGLLEHALTLEVVDPVLGSATGDRLRAVDAIGVLGSDADDRLRTRINEAQALIDELNRPLAEIDRRILRLEPTDPTYEGLLVERERLSAATRAELGVAQAGLIDLQGLLNALDLRRRGQPVTPLPCPELTSGDDAIIALGPAATDGTSPVGGPSTILKFVNGRFDPASDRALRAAVGDTALLDAARSASIDALIEALRAAA